MPDLPWQGFVAKEGRTEAEKRSVQSVPGYWGRLSITKTKADETVQGLRWQGIYDIRRRMGRVLAQYNPSTGHLPWLQRNRSQLLN